MWANLPEGFVIPLSPLTVKWSADGACPCCGCRDTLHTGGCITCGGCRTYCSCGAFLACGCGRSYTHVCPSVISAGTVTLIPIASLFHDDEDA